MLQEAIKKNDKFKLSRIELERHNISFTIDTLRQFLDYEKMAQATIFYLIGYDNLVEFHLWKSYRSILKICQVVVLQRSGEIDSEIIKKYGDDVLFLDSPCINISATEIRKKISRGVDVSDSVPAPVLEIIRKHGLYKNDT